MAASRPPPRRHAHLKTTIDVDPAWLEGLDEAKPAEKKSHPSKMPPIPKAKAKTSEAPAAPKMPSKMPPLPRRRAGAAKTMEVDPAWLFEEETKAHAKEHAKEKDEPRKSAPRHSKTPPRPVAPAVAAAPPKAAHPASLPRPTPKPRVPIPREEEDDPPQKKPKR